MLCKRNVTGKRKLTNAIFGLLKVKRTTNIHAFFNLHRCSTKELVLKINFKISLKLFLKKNYRKTPALKSLFKKITSL